MTPRLLIRHLTGSMVNRVDQFPLSGLNELTLGRAPTSDVRFHGPYADVVSRCHAVIRISRDRQTSFTIVDQGSSNGVRVNGKPVREQQELSVNNVVELGPGGPSFMLTIEPDAPEQKQARTPAAKAAAVPPIPPASAAVASDRGGARTAAYCAALALAVVAGASVEHDAISRGRDWAGNQIRRVFPGTGSSAVPTAGSFAGNLPVPPRAEAPETTASVPAVATHLPDPTAAAPAATAASDAVVYVEARWRLYDRYTGQPVYQKVLLRRGQRLPCFVEDEDGQVVPWLTTANDDHRNIPIGGVVRGSGFIATSDGAVITSRHVAAGWTARYSAASALGRQAAVFSARTARFLHNTFRLVDLAALQGQGRLAAWTPGDSGTLFAAGRPTVIGSAQGNLEGRNEALTVLLPSSHASTSARLVLVSSQADVAELRIDAGRDLPILSLSNEPSARLGEAVTILGYSGAAALPLERPGGAEAQTGGAPPPLSATGTIAGLPSAGPGGSTPADLYRVAASATNTPEGAPVLGADGTTLGIVTADGTEDAQHMSATPVQAARALLESR